MRARGLESYSDDSFLSWAASRINVLQWNGPSAVPKHSVANDLEENIHSIDIVVSIRALNEKYITLFQLATICNRTGAVMTI
jgi:beta-glucosidase-like glycosyl hydrolase